MHVISKRPFNDASLNHPNHKQAIDDLYKVLKKGVFKKPEDLKALIPSLDNFSYKDKYWVIDIAGNHLRLIAFIQFIHNRIYIKKILTHPEYDKYCDKCSGKRK